MKRFLLLLVIGVAVEFCQAIDDLSLLLIPPKNRQVDASKVLLGGLSVCLGLGLLSEFDSLLVRDLLLFLVSFRLYLEAVLIRFHATEALILFNL